MNPLQIQACRAKRLACLAQGLTHQAPY